MRRTRTTFAGRPTSDRRRLRLGPGPGCGCCAEPRERQPPTPRPPGWHGAATAAAGRQRPASSPSTAGRSADAGVGVTVPVDQERDAGQAEDDVGQPARQAGRQDVRLGQGRSDHHQGVEHEDHRQPDHEAGVLAVLAVRDAEAERQQAEDQAGRREGELLVEVHHLVVRRHVQRPLLGDLRLQLGDGHLGRAVHDLGLREDVVGVQLDGLRGEALDLVLGGVLGVGPV